MGGSTPSRDNPAYWGGDIPWVTPTDLLMPGEGISTITSTSQTITQDGLNSSAAALVPPGTVLFSSRATIGKVGIAAVPLATNQGFANLVPREGMNPRFLAYSLWNGTERIAKLAGSTTFKEVSRGNLRKFIISVPPLPEQHRIVSLLDEADELRRRREQADRRTANLIPALFYEMFGDLATNSKGWKVSPMQRLCVGPPTNGIFRKIEDYGDGLPVVWVEELFHGLSVDVSSSRRLQPTKSDIDKYGLRKGDLLFCRSSLVREGVGQIAYYDGDDAAAMFECHLIRISPNICVILPEFATVFFRLPCGKGQILSQSRTATMTTIGQKDLLRLNIPVPPINLQRQFAARVAEIRALQTCQAESRRRLDDLFQSMLHRAFQGEL